MYPPGTDIMVTPFDTPAGTITGAQHSLAEIRLAANRGRIAAQPATDAQIIYIANLIESRAWQLFDNAAYVRRVASLSAIMTIANDPESWAVIDGVTSADKGERINQLFARARLSSTAERPEYAPFSKSGASLLIDWLKSLPVREAPVAPSLPETGATYSSEMPSADVVPAGRYAVDTNDGSINEIAFYKVDRPTKGKWAGYAFVKLIVGDDEQRLNHKAQQSVLAKIAAVGAAEASARYGHEIGACGVCGRQLTNDESRARGIGPKCAANVGW
jgi:hypothetical protein